MSPRPLGKALASACAPGSPALSPTLPPRLRPIEPKELAVKLVQTFAIWKLPDNWDAIAPFYREALADVPADLAEFALRHVRLTCKWLPKPAELREPIAELLATRQRVHAERERRAAEGAAQVPQPGPRP
jgi:hypothetical protein